MKWLFTVDDEYINLTNIRIIYPKKFQKTYDVYREEPNGKLHIIKEKLIDIDQAHEFIRNMLNSKETGIIN